MNERGRYDKRNQKGQGGSDPVCTLFHIYCLYGSSSSLFKMAKLGSCGDNLWAFGEYRTSDADRTVQQTGEVILFCYDMDEYYFIYGIHGWFVSYHGNSSSKCCDVVSF